MSFNLTTLSHMTLDIPTMLTEGQAQQTYKPSGQTRYQVIGKTAFQ
ncbi:MAG: hypothetical protein NVS9B9_28230 [Ktedonobacteraceae bacterium]